MIFRRKDTPRVAVIGGGIWGLSAAWACMRHGFDTALIEQGPLPNPGNASSDEHRLIRHAYGEAKGYARLIDWAFAAWENLWDDLGQKLYAETGALALSAAPGDFADASRKSLADLGIPHEVLDGATLARRWPMLATGDLSFGLWTAAGGVLFADRIAARLVPYLAGHGVQLRPRTRIERIDADRGVITTGDGRASTFDAVIIAAGPWVEKLVPKAAPGLWVKRHPVAYITPPQQFAEAWTRVPIIVDFGRIDAYLAPPVNGTRLKIGVAAIGRADDPDAPLEPEAGEGERVLDALRDRFTEGADYRVAETRVGRFPKVPGDRFLIEQRGRMFLMTGCSGHGYKFGPMLGLAVADTIAGERPAPQLSRWCAGALA